MSRLTLHRIAKGLAIVLLIALVGVLVGVLIHDRVVESKERAVQVAGLERTVRMLEARRSRMRRAREIDERLQVLEDELVEHPEIEPYLYEGRRLEKEGDATARHVEGFCRRLAEFLEFVAGDGPYASDEWESFAREVYRTSPAFQDLLADPERRQAYPSLAKWLGL